MGSAIPFRVAKVTEVVRVPVAYVYHQLPLDEASQALTRSSSDAYQVTNEIALHPIRYYFVETIRSRVHLSPC
jgi:hypothetical protein